MTYPVTKLITNAYYLAGIVSREFETVDGTQISDGLDFLNDIIGEKRVDAGTLPYYTSTTFNTVIGQELYTVDGLISVSTATFLKDNVRWAMDQIDRDEYQGSFRTENIQSLPFTFHVERIPNGANIYLYWLPDEVYTVTLWGLFDLGEVTLTQDLELTMDRFYITYLRYLLAERLCCEFDYDIPPATEKKLNKLEAQIRKKSQQLDLRMRKISTLSGAGIINYGQINLGKGWYPISFS